MFSWFWEFLYNITKTIFRLIDGLILCANKLCGIDPINFNGESTDFLTYLMRSDEISFAFKISAMLATILIVVFAVFLIIRSIAKDKSEGTAAQIAIKAFKTLLMFFFVPVVVLAFMTLGNIFIKALYSATMHTSSTPGFFLFYSFAEDGGMGIEALDSFKNGELQYTNTAHVSAAMPLSDYPYLFAWIAGGVVLFGVGSAMLIFVDRVLSIVILYIAAPISISTSLLDDGARFKLWRDQFLSKFIMGYGMILAINIYALVCALIMDPDLVFFPEAGSDLLNLIMKLLIIGGGALNLQKSMALVGNLVSQGAGSNELRDSMSVGSLARMTAGAASSAGRFAAKTAWGIGGLPLRAAGSILGDALSMQSRHLGGRILRGLGLGGGGEDPNKKKDDKKEDSGSQNSDKPNYGSDGNAKDAINGGFKTSFDTSKNDNNNNTKPKGNDNVANAIKNDKKDDKGKQEGQNSGNTTDPNKQEGNK